MIIAITNYQETEYMALRHLHLILGDLEYVDNLDIQIDKYLYSIEEWIDDLYESIPPKKTRINKDNGETIFNNLSNGHIENKSPYLLLEDIKNRRRIDL